MKKVFKGGSFPACHLVFSRNPPMVTNLIAFAGWRLIETEFYFQLGDSYGDQSGTVGYSSLSEV